MIGVDDADVRGCADCKESMVPVLILPLGVVAAVALSLAVDDDVNDCGCAVVGVVEVVVGVV